MHGFPEPLPFLLHEPWRSVFPSLSRPVPVTAWSIELRSDKSHHRRTEPDNSARDLRPLQAQGAEALMLERTSGPTSLGCFGLRPQSIPLARYARITKQEKNSHSGSSQYLRSVLIKSGSGSRSPNEDVSRYQPFTQLCLWRLHEFDDALTMPALLARAKLPNDAHDGAFDIATSLTSPPNCPFPSTTLTNSDTGADNADLCSAPPVGIVLQGPRVPQVLKSLVL